MEESHCQGSTIPASWNGVNNDSHHTVWPLRFTKHIITYQAFREGQVPTPVTENHLPVTRLASVLLSTIIMNKSFRL